MFWTSMITGTSKYPPFSKLHIELLEQFEGSITFTNFIEPLLPKNRTEQPWRKYQLQTSGLLAVNIYAAN